MKAYGRVCWETNRKCNLLLSENLQSSHSWISRSAWQFAPALLGKAHKRVILKHQKKYNSDLKHNTFFTEVNISVLRQTVLYSLECTLQAHSLQFIVISHCSVNKLHCTTNLLFTSYLHFVIMRGFLSWQNSAFDKNLAFCVVSGF